MKVYIVTPSYNQFEWLRLCCASVADQARNSFEVHHHIQDACSTDGTVQFLTEYCTRQPLIDNYHLTFCSEVDEGMYDAINRGWERAPEDADIIAHLNCDEQYLPGALEKAVRCFTEHPRSDVVFANMIVIDGNGEYICHRRPLPPLPIHSRLFIPGFTCTTFQRRSVFFDKECRFDTSWKNLGDMVWNLSLIEKGCRFRMLNEYTSLFADTGDNLNLAESGAKERKRYYDMVPRWMKLVRPVMFFHKRIRYALRMAVSKTPKSYSLFVPFDDSRRIEKPIVRPTCVWSNRKQWRHAMIQQKND